MNVTAFMGLREKVVVAGYGDEIAWQESASEPETADEFMWQYIWVVISSGIKNQIARIIEQRVVKAYNEGEPVSSAFGHKGKAEAIEYMMKNHDEIYEDYLESTDRLGFLKGLPWIGDITKWHLAKNLGEDVAKPDRHLVRIAESYNTTPSELCKRLAGETGYRVATVDLIIWRAANLGYA